MCVLLLDDGSFPSKPMNETVDGNFGVAKFLLFSGHDTTCKLHTLLSIRPVPVHKSSMVVEKDSPFFCCCFCFFIQLSASPSCDPAS